MINTALPMSPRVGIADKDNSYELHWRREPPIWQGNIEMAYRKYYPHLAEVVHCRHCGAVPCPADHDAEKRTRLKDLEFIKELAKDRRELAAKLAKTNEEMTKMSQKAKEWELEKMLLMDEMKALQQDRKTWETEKQVMEAEINRLKGLNEYQQEMIQEYKRDTQKLKVLTKQVEALEEENNNLREENQKYRKMISNQCDEINRLFKENRKMIEELEASEEKIRSLNVQLTDAIEERDAAINRLKESEKQMQELRSQIHNLVMELTNKTKQFEEKEIENEKLMDYLREQIYLMQQQLGECQGENETLRCQISEYLREIERLRQRLASDKRFQQFVSIKREVNDLRDKNEGLMVRVVTENPPVLPYMQASGRVKSAGVKLGLSHGELPGKSVTCDNRPLSSRGSERVKSARRTISVDHYPEDI